MLTRAEAIAQVAARWSTCTGCGLSQGRRNVVPGEIHAAPDVDVNSDPLLLIVGEAPGTTDDATGRPFQGPAGKILHEDLLRQAGVRLALITTAVACRPPSDRDPTAAECQACHRRLAEVVQACRPAAVLMIGKVAEAALREGVQLDGVDLLHRLPRVGIVHPAGLLRQGHPNAATAKALKTAQAKLDRLLQRADMGPADGGPVDPAACRHQPVRVGSWRAEDGTQGPEIWACKRCALFVEP
jgi:DNA polymerase